MTTDKVAIVDLGLGNLHSVAKAFERAGADPELSTDPDVLLRADRLVMPGQGAFKECAHALAGEIGEAVRSWIESGRPYLGICRIFNVHDVHLVLPITHHAKFAFFGPVDNSRD